ncbi:MAG: hypothetical protein AAF757_18680 [Cyanobacteria bacterium P01_D01_bin.116]
MDGFFNDQVRSNYFTGQVRQRGSGLGALALKIGGTAFPILKKYVLPAAKRVGKQFAMDLAPELLGVVDGSSSVKKAVKRAAKRTTKRQLGGGRKAKRPRRSKSKKKRTTTSSKKSTRNSRSRKRTKYDIFSDLR